MALVASRRHANKTFLPNRVALGNQLIVIPTRPDAYGKLLDAQPRGVDLDFEKTVAELKKLPKPKKPKPPKP